MDGNTRRVSLADVLISQGRDWPALEATVLLDGQKVAHVSNDGSGAADVVFPLNKQLWLELQAVAEKWSKDNSGDAAISEMVDHLLLS